MFFSSVVQKVHDMKRLTNLCGEEHWVLAGASGGSRMWVMRRPSWSKRSRLGRLEVCRSPPSRPSYTQIASQGQRPHCFFFSFFPFFYFCFILAPIWERITPDLWPLTLGSEVRGVTAGSLLPLLAVGATEEEHRHGDDHLACQLAASRRNSHIAYETLRLALS